MYCKVCFDAGKPEEVFTSHAVKNQFGMVTCVTLLEHNCESCGCIGHTPKYCPSPRPAKKFCPFCKDNGRTYTDHNMWENGLIVCEELLCTQCVNCGNMGHPPKWCTAVKFCPVCRDAGRDYNHDLTVDGVVVCEYLLGLECGNCGDLGHTRKYCTQPPPKFCPVCKDAGNDHKHDLMRDGVVVCEYLLGLECGNCGELGHTRKYCTNPRKKSNAEKLQEGNNLGIRLEAALLKEAPIKPPKKKGAKQYVRVL